MLEHVCKQLLSNTLPGLILWESGRGVLLISLLKFYLQPKIECDEHMLVLPTSPPTWNEYLTAVSNIPVVGGGRLIEHLSLSRTQTFAFEQDSKVHVLPSASLLVRGTRREAQEWSTPFTISKTKHVCPLLFVQACRFGFGLVWWVGVPVEPSPTTGSLVRSLPNPN